MDWIGNLLIAYGYYTTTNEKRWGFYPYVVGELVYVVYAYNTQAWGLLALCLLFSVLGVRGWILMGARGDHERAGDPAGECTTDR
jgi:hypothetical protein